MHLITTALSVALICQVVTPQIHIGLGGAASGLRHVIGDGLSGAIGGRSKGGIGGNIIGGAEAAAERLIHGRGRHEHSDEDSDESDVSDEERKYDNDNNGRGIWKGSGIGSHDGIRTPINDLLGLTKSICRVSYAGENIIEKLGEFQLFWQEEVKRFDRKVADYLTDRILANALDMIRKAHINLVDFLLSAHITWDRFIINTIIEGYRVTKAPIRELFACY